MARVGLPSYLHIKPWMDEEILIEIRQRRRDYLAGYNAALAGVRLRLRKQAKVEYGE